MALLSYAYGALPLHMAGKKVDWLVDDIRVALVGVGYTPNQDTHDFWDDVVANELATASGYTAGGIALAGKTITYDAVLNRQAFKANNVSWTFSASLSWRYAVLYDRTPATDATRPLLAYLDYGAVQTTSGVVDITWSTDGVLLGAVL